MEASSVTLRFLQPEILAVGDAASEGTEAEGNTRKEAMRIRNPLRFPYPHFLSRMS